MEADLVWTDEPDGRGAKLVRGEKILALISYVPCRGYYRWVTNEPCTGVSPNLAGAKRAAEKSLGGEK